MKLFVLSYIALCIESKGTPIQDWNTLVRLLSIYFVCSVLTKALEECACSLSMELFRSQEEGRFAESETETESSTVVGRTMVLRKYLIPASSALRPLKRETANKVNNWCIYTKAVGNQTVHGTFIYFATCCFNHCREEHFQGTNFEFNPTLF